MSNNIKQNIANCPILFYVFLQSFLTLWSKFGHSSFTEKSGFKGIGTESWSELKTGISHRLPLQ